MKDKFYLSPSSLNLFIEDQAVWVLKHFYGIVSKPNIYMVRGKLVEEVINIWYYKNRSPSLEECFIPMIAKILEDDVEVSVQDMKDFYKWGSISIDKFRGFGKPESMQKRLKGKICGLDMHGYIDYEYKDVIVDLKTTNKLPIIVSRGDRKGLISKGKAAHVRQQIIYNKLSNKKTALLYIDPYGDNIYYPITERDVEEQNPIIEEAVNKIKKCLTLNKEDVIIDIKPKSYNGFFWTPELKMKAKEIWNGK